MKEHFTIGEISALTGLSSHALRYYDKIGLVRPEAVNDQTGYRLYSYLQLFTLDWIRHLQLLGFKLDQIRELGFRIDVKRPPEHDRWECSITFNGKDLSSSENADMCLFLEEFRENREEYAAYGHSASSYQDWKDKTLAYYAAVPLSERETEELTEEERISRRNAFLKEQFRS